MKYSPEIQFENVVQADPTLKFFLRDVTMDYDKLPMPRRCSTSILLSYIITKTDRSHE